MRQRHAMRVVRAVLLVLLALGVCGMHTLGHLHGRHGGAPARTHGMEVAPAPQGLPAFAPDHAMPGFDPSDVCLAILVTFIVLLLGAGWTRVRRHRDATGGMPPSIWQAARPPPKLTSRRLSILSMLRI